MQHVCFSNDYMCLIAITHLKNKLEKSKLNLKCIFSTSDKSGSLIGPVDVLVPQVNFHSGKK